MHAQHTSVIGSAKQIPSVDFISAIAQQSGCRIGNMTLFDWCPACGPGPEGCQKLVVGRSWECTTCGQYGDALDAARHWYGAPNCLAAAKSMLQDFAFVGGATTAVSEEIAQEDLGQSGLAGRIVQRLADVLGAQQLDAKVRTYLMKDCGLPAKVVNDAVTRGLVCSLPADPVNATRFLLAHFPLEYLHAAGLWKRGARMPAIAFRPLMLVTAGRRAAEFRMIEEPREHEPKALQYGGEDWWMWRNKSERALIVQDPLAVLSKAVTTDATVLAFPPGYSWDAWPDQRFSALPWHVKVERQRNIAESEQLATRLFSRLTALGHQVSTVLVE